MSASSARENRDIPVIAWSEVGANDHIFVIQNGHISPERNDALQHFPDHGISAVHQPFHRPVSHRQT
jgi:hypothetical protein